MRQSLRNTWITSILFLLLGCATPQPTMTTQPIKWLDPDTRPIQEPRKIDQNLIWDILYLTFFNELAKPLDIGWTSRRLGNIVGIVPPREADNVNALDEVPNSSWYTNRHFLNPLEPNQLIHGPGDAHPDTTGKWEVIRGKFEGLAPGLTIKDAIGNVYFVKFEAKGNDELASTADVVSSKILYAAGYNVPRNSAVYFKSNWLTVGANVPYPDGQGGKRAMTQTDLDNLIATIASREDGNIRCLASKLIEGKPIGIFNFQDRRSTDANDRVEHQHRRELRGLRVISSWINDVDRRAANTLNMFVKDQNGHGYVKHYLIDMGASLGSSSIRPRTPKSGNEYFVDLRQIIPSTLGLGLYHKEWEEPLPMKYSSIGYLESEVFSPSRWVTNYPNPAFQRCTARDGYWGAKIVMSFTNTNIETLVKSGQLSNPDAEKELVRLLKERRDKIGRYWFSKINPLDHFWIDREGLHFEDLAVKGNLAQVNQTTYTYRTLNNNGAPIGQNQKASATRIPIPSSLTKKQYHSIEIRTQRPDASPKPTRVFFYKWDDGRYQIVKIERDT